jgi:hypothetical protein
MSGDDGRVVQVADFADDLSGRQSIDALHARGVVVRIEADPSVVPSGVVDVGKKLRPNLRGGRFVLFVEPAGADGDNGAQWRAIKLP